MRGREERKGRKWKKIKEENDKSMTGGFYESRGYKIGAIVEVESKIQHYRKLGQPLLKKVGALSRDYC